MGKTRYATLRGVFRKMQEQKEKKMNRVKMLFAFLAAIIASPFVACRRLFVAGAAAVFALSLSVPAFAQLYEQETILGTISMSETGVVTIPVDATISSGIAIWFALFVIGVFVALITYLRMFRRK